MRASQQLDSADPARVSLPLHRVKRKEPRETLEPGNDVSTFQNDSLNKLQNRSYSDRTAD